MNPRSSSIGRRFPSRSVSTRTMSGEMLRWHLLLRTRGGQERSNKPRRTSLPGGQRFQDQSLPLQPLGALVARVGHLQQNGVLSALRLVQGGRSPNAHEFGDLEIAKVLPIDQDRESFFRRTVFILAPQIAVACHPFTPFTESIHASPGYLRAGTSPARIPFPFSRYFG